MDRDSGGPGRRRTTLPDCASWLTAGAKTLAENDDADGARLTRSADQRSLQLRIVRESGGIRPGANVEPLMPIWLPISPVQRFSRLRRAFVRLETDEAERHEMV